LAWNTLSSSRRAWPKSLGVGFGLHDLNRFAMIGVGIAPGVGDAPSKNGNDGGRFRFQTLGDALTCSKVMTALRLA